MEVKINREIRNYTEAMFFGLSLRQFIFSACACVVAVGIYFLLNCLLLDEGEGCVCVQSISYSLLCRYFRSAVLPADPALEAEILGTHPDRCVSCGAPIIKRGNRKKYCEKCADIAYKRQQAEYARKKRAESKNRG